MNQISDPGATYGGSWTVEKLNILESYLDAYTTALKKQPFKLVYIDAFAGTGYVEFQDEDVKYLIDGSAARAAKINDKPFDKLIFIEKDRERCRELEKLRQEHPDRNIQIENLDANDYLKKLRLDWNNWRGVLFIDPFATQVQWSTIETIASFNALDTWILFPTSAIARMLPTSKMPDDVMTAWADRLKIVFGDESWRVLYHEPLQMSFLGKDTQVRIPGVEDLISTFKKNLKGLFDKRFLDKSRTLTTRTKSPLFEFLFCVGHPKGIKVAKRIANHILEYI